MLMYAAAAGLIESLSSGASTDQRYGASFDISVSLTEEGLKKKESVLSLIFQYIRLVREAGALKWVWQVYVCPHTTICVSACSCIYLLMLLYVCPHGLARASGCGRSAYD
jgi:hypothetical protein